MKSLFYGLMAFCAGIGILHMYAMSLPSIDDDYISAGIATIVVFSIVTALLHRGLSIEPLRRMPLPQLPNEKEQPGLVKIIIDGTEYMVRPELSEAIFSLHKAHIASLREILENVPFSEIDLVSREYKKCQDHIEHMGKLLDEQGYDDKLLFSMYMNRKGLMPPMPWPSPGRKMRTDFGPKDNLKDKAQTDSDRVAAYKKQEEYLPTKEELADNEEEIIKELLQDVERMDTIETLVLNARNQYKSDRKQFDHKRRPYETPFLWFVRLVDYASDKHDGSTSQEALDYARHISGTDFSIMDYLKHKIRVAEEEQDFTTTSGGNYIPTFDLNDLYRDQFSGMVAMVEDFHKMTGAHIGTEPALLEQKLNDLRLSLVAEEARESHDAESILLLADGLSDLLYVALGWVVAAGMQDKIFDCFCEVHSSNMSKACDTYEEATLQRDKIFLASEEGGYAGHFANVFERDGRFVIVRHDGKILKGNKYFEPNLSQFFQA